MRTILAAVPWLWRSLRCPVYATPFAAAVLRRKLAEAQLLAEVQLHVVPPGARLTLAPFRSAVRSRRPFHRPRRRRW